jgi:hypothetical protein
MVILTVTIMTTHPKTGRKEIWQDGKLVQVISLPPGYVGGW